MPTYELWNKDNTELINTVETEDAVKIVKMLNHDYLLVVEPVIDYSTHKKGDLTFTDKERGWKIVLLSQGELDTIAAAEVTAASSAALAADIAQALLDGNLVTLTYTELEAATTGQTAIVRKLARITWAFLKERNRVI